MKCSRCAKEIVKPADSIGTGYGKDKDGKVLCYACCAELDKERMQANGKIALYLTRVKSEWIVTNWPGTLTYRVSVSISKHGHYSPFSGYMERRDAWFVDENDRLWHGKSLGGWTDICHCKMLKDNPTNRADVARLKTRFS